MYEEQMKSQEQITLTKEKCQNSVKQLQLNSPMEEETLIGISFTRDKM